jgi:hypothetical protein
LREVKEKKWTFAKLKEVVWTFSFIKLKEKNIMLHTLLGLWTKPVLLMASSSKSADGFCGW